MNNSILIIGIKTQAFLKAASMGLKRCGYHVELEKQGGSQNFKLTMNNYSGIHQSFDCRCLEISLSAIEPTLDLISIEVKKATHLIAVIPVKLFSSWRYNIDDDLSGVSGWITPDRLQNILHRSIAGREVVLLWAITGTDMVQSTLSGIRHANNIASVIESRNATEFLTKADEAVKEFLVEDEEVEFIERCKNHEIVSFGFLPGQTASWIGEKVSTLWNVSTLLKATLGYIPDNLLNKL